MYIIFTTYKANINERGGNHDYGTVTKFENDSLENGFLIRSDTPIENVEIFTITS